MKRFVAGIPLALGALLLATAAPEVPRAQEAAATFVKQVPWYGNGVWMKIDTHIHTQFSDGVRTVEDIAARAQPNGLDAIAITDHSDANLRAATYNYFEAINNARQKYPKLIIITGVEWNVPPHKGQGHVVVLVDKPAERQLAEFKTRFDDLQRTGENPELGVKGIEWLAENATVDGLAPLALYEHPSRSASLDIDTAADFRRWRAVNEIVIGYSGAPGHQGTKPIGSYKGRQQTIDRWDPIVQPGQAWDRLLAEGFNVWAAGAPSDFHEERLTGLADYRPGIFSETWVYAPERSIRGVLQALRAGSYFGDHGRIVRNVDFRVVAPGLPRAASAGEVIAVPKGATVDVEMSFDVSDDPWRSGPNSVEVVELIAVTPNKAWIEASEPPRGNGPQLRRTMQISEETVFRGRGYHLLETGTKLAFYTNPVRVKVQR